MDNPMHPKILEIKHLLTIYFNGRFLKYKFIKQELAQNIIKATVFAKEFFERFLQILRQRNFQELQEFFQEEPLDIFL